MDVIKISVFILLVGITLKEIRYFSSHIIFTYKSVYEYTIFVCGILLLIYITAVYAVGWFNIAFGAVGVIAMAAAWLKQGVTQKGVLTLTRGQEFFPWEDIDCVHINRGEVNEVRWLKASGAVIAKQKYSDKALSELLEILQSNGIAEKK